MGVEEARKCNQRCKKPRPTRAREIYHDALFHLGMTVCHAFDSERMAFRRPPMRLALIELDPATPWLRRGINVVRGAEPSGYDEEIWKRLG